MFRDKNRMIDHSLESAPKLYALVLGAFVSLFSSLAVAGDNSALDCALRDAGYSVELPAMEILLKPEAVEVVNRHLPGMLDRMPPQFMSKEPPSLSAIIPFAGIAGMTGADSSVIGAIDTDLRALKVTDADRQARCARYDNEIPELKLADAEVNVLVFHKINGFDHGPSVTAATAALKVLAEQLGWGIAVTDKAGVFNPESLARFDVVVWNNNSGDVLTLTQRKAFEDYINNGGGFVGIHGAGGDSLYLWEWYADTLLGGRFIGHPNNPQFQDARVDIEKTKSRIGMANAPGWTMNDEWYSFEKSARELGASVVATLDESSYDPGDLRGRDLHMGDDHPIAWTRCVGNGRSFYSAIGHRSEVYHMPENLVLLRDGLQWAAGKGSSECRKGKEINRK